MQDKEDGNIVDKNNALYISNKMNHRGPMQETMNLCIALTSLIGLPSGLSPSVVLQ